MTVRDGRIQEAEMKTKALEDAKREEAALAEAHSNQLLESLKIAENTGKELTLITLIAIS